MDQNDDSSPAVFTPGNEPYLGRRPLLQFDRIIVATLRANRAVAAASRDRDLTDLQRAASQIIPQGVSIGLSIRELLRQGYLFSAFVLVRPLIERAAIISYLVRHPEAVQHWKSGWKLGERPSLRRMLDAMGWSEVDTSMATDRREVPDGMHAQQNEAAFAWGMGAADAQPHVRPDRWLAFARRGRSTCAFGSRNVSSASPRRPYGTGA